MASFLTMMYEIHIMLVEHDSQDMINTTRLLEMCQYKVTGIELASIAITMLLRENTKFDIVMANIDSWDLHRFELLQLAVNMDIPIILMSAEDNAFEAMRAIKRGAFLYIQKPTKLEMLRCLWQHVHRKKRHMIKEKGRLIAENYSFEGSSNMLFFKSRENIGVRKGVDEDEEKDYDSENHSTTNSKRKVGLEWTPELHEKFMAAAEQLGEGRCVPQKILELMNVPGLTRTQVKNHLQRCRDGSWKSPQERRYGSLHKSRKYGLMPELGKTRSYPCQVPGSSHVAQQGSQSPSEIQKPDDGGIDNVGIRHVMTSSHPQKQHGSMLPHPNNAIQGTHSSNPWYPYDDIFSFQETDSLFQHYSSSPQGFEALDNPKSTSDGYHFNPTHDEENSALPRIDIESQWSTLETSNFLNDDSRTKGI